MAEERRRVTDSKLRQFWHNWMPIISFCASALIGFGGAVWAVSSYKSNLDHSLNDLKDGQSKAEDRLTRIEIEHHVMVNKLDRVMFRLHIPLDDSFPVDHYAWPQDQRKGPDANLDKDLDKLYRNEKHSRAVPPDPVLGLMKVPSPPLVSGMRGR